MVTSVRIITFISYFLLVFNGIGALYGGYHFITDPTGASLGMQISFMKTGPFQDYFYPGLMLLLFNGIFSFITWWLFMVKSPVSWLFLMLQGLILLIWILTQILILQMVYPVMHYTFLFIALFFIICGAFFRQKSIKPSN